MATMRGHKWDSAVRLGRTGLFGTALLLLGAVAAMAAATSSATSVASVTTTVAAVADARVQEGNPNANFGTEQRLASDGDAGRRIEVVLGFDLTQVAGTVERATLRLHVGSDATSDGPAAYAGAGSWSETGVTWRTRPQATGPATADLGAVAAQTWVELDVTAIAAAKGVVTVLLAQPGPDGAAFASRERAGYAPQLVVTSTTGEAAPTAPPSTTAPALPPPPPPSFPAAARPGWLAWGYQIGDMLALDSELTRWAYDDPGTFIIGADPPGDQTRVPDSWKATAAVKFESAADFEAKLAAGALDPGVACVVYDPENWVATPDAEKADPATSMRRFVETARAAGFTCVGLAPSRDLAAYQPGPCPTSGTMSQKYLDCGIPMMAAEAGADWFEVQSQVLEDDPAEFADFLKRAVDQARAVRPDLPVYGGFSTSPYNYIATPAMLLAAYDASWPLKDLNGNQLVQGYKTFVPAGEESIMLGFFTLLRARASA